jgi:serine/threonine-protein kinase
MTEQRGQRVRALFEQAADLPPAEQQALLDACCAADPDLRARVEHLLACDAGLRAGAGAGALLDSRLVRAPQKVAAVAEGCPSTAEDPGPPRGDPAAGAEVSALSVRLGRYELLEEIGRGGMGAVLRGHDPDLGRDLAVKVLLPEHRHDAAMRSRFAEEAQIGGQLQHPGIVPVYEVGRAADQQPYFTMKLVKGRTLAALLAERSDPGEDLPRFEQIFEQVCQTLAYAHSRGVIHRDLKPANIMVGAFGEVQVMDWGLAKVLTRGPETPPKSAVRTARSVGEGDKTRPGWVAGTPAYMAPEQAAGEVDRLDQRCDVFGLGGILCEILTGRPPYVGADDLEVFSRALRADLAEAFACLDGCGADLELIRLAHGSLAAQAADRPRDAGVLAVEMAAYRESLATRLHQAELAQAEARARAAEERKRRRLRLGLAAFVLLTVLLAGGAWLWLRQARDARDRQALEALAQAELLRQQAQAGGDPGKWADALALARRAEALLEQGTGRPEAAERARALLQVLDEEEADRRLLARVDKIQLVKVEQDSKVLGFGYRGAIPQYAEAFEEYGMKAGAVPPKEAAARIGQRPPQVQARIVGALDDWLSVIWWWEPGDAGTAEWVEAVLTAADPDPWRQRLRRVLRTREQGEMQRLAEEVDVARQPPWTLMLVGMALRSRGPSRQGVALMRRAQGQYPGDFWVNWELGWQLDQDPDKTDDPVRFFRAAVALRPDSPLVRLTLANSLAQRGEVDKAITVLGEAIEVKPDMAVLHSNLGIFLNRKGDHDKAIGAYRRAIELEPDYAPAYRGLIFSLNQRGDQARLDKLLEPVRQLIKRKPRESEAYAALGALLLKKNDRDGATVAFRQARDALPPHDFEGHFNLARNLKDERFFDDALTLLRRCEALATQTKRADLRERVAGAVRELEQGQWLVPGREHAGRREWGQAARCYTRLLERDPNQSSEVYFEHAAVLLLSGDRDGYRHACARTVERGGKEKGFGPYLAARACTLAPDCAAEAARAGPLAEQEMKAFPNAYWWQTEQAALHYRAGRFDRALPLLEQGLKGDRKPGDAVLNRLWLALTCQKLGQKAQARTWLETATKWLDQYRDGLPPRAEQELGLHLHNWLEAHVLRAEAETLLGAAPATPK